MKYLFILLFLISSHSYTQENIVKADGKGIDCKLHKKISPGQRNSIMFWFNNNKVASVFLGYSNYGKEGKPKTKNIKDWHLAKFYLLTPDKITWYSDDKKNIQYIFYRKSLILEQYDNRNNTEIIEKASCIEFEGFAEVKKRQKEMLATARQ